ncbi:blue copper protein 1a-like [Hordeum vulgare subsp. vulgare]|uniref:blue copper protein 1a-like n=1 Tax=Hordeum vulgare subsp. vulgare TaxID=112509 RepID=UPI001D1A4D6C|nr:blue copper protein 1a-like [Hordeum vulgare subsp. vulgare]
MASKQMLVTVVAAAALAVAFLPGLAVATEHMVGDEKGWSLNCNYTAWAETQQFAVGDTLVFKYNIGAHNVVEVAGPDFLTCTQSANAIIWNSGEDQVTLDKAGRRWFFCGVDQHCQNGMKLKITVFETAAPTPQPALSA